MNNVMTTEEQRRGQAFMQARKRLEQEYNCTTTIVPKWVDNVCGTFVLGFDEQVMVGPMPVVDDPTPKRQEEIDETEK